jgi:hypothetical protein
MFLVARTGPTVREPKPLREVSLRPRVGVPQEIRGKFLFPALAAAVVFSVLGFYSALIPTLLGESLHNHIYAIAGGIVAALFFIGVLTIAFTRQLASNGGLIFSLGLLLPSVILLVVSE